MVRLWKGVCHAHWQGLYPVTNPSLTLKLWDLACRATLPPNIPLETSFLEISTWQIPSPVLRVHGLLLGEALWDLVSKVSFSLIKKLIEFHPFYPITIIILNHPVITCQEVQPQIPAHGAHSKVGSTRPGVWCPVLPRTRWPRASFFISLRPLLRIEGDTEHV